MHSFIDNQPTDLSGETLLTALIDADSIIYIIAAGCGDTEDVYAICQEADQFVSQMLVQLQCRQYAGYFSPKKCFRHDIYPEYKGKRKPPSEVIQKWKPTIYAWLRQKWGFGEWDNHEADDAVSIMQSNMLNSIICSPDKDLKQVPGNNFDYRKGTRSYITQEMADYNFCYQMLLGDSGDNIPGCKGVGKVGAEKILAHVPSNNDIHSLVMATYDHVYGTDLGTNEYLNQACLIRTKRIEENKGDLEFLRQFLHVFDLDAAGTSSYLSASGRGEDATKLFGDW